MRLSVVALVALTSWPVVQADVEIISPTAGTTYPAGNAIRITWTESNTAPLISDLSGYTISLFSGSNTAPISLAALTSGTFAASGNTATIVIPPALSGTQANAYFIGIQSTGKAGGTVSNYSPRFSLSGMTGKFKPEIITALAAVSGTAGPPTTNNIAAGTSSLSSSSMAGDKFAIPYPSQVGDIRYAPMQPIPGSKITATNTKPLFPTSSVKIATTFMSAPAVATTMTKSQTFSTLNHMNTAAAQAQPSDDMEKYLNRWKD